MPQPWVRAVPLPGFSMPQCGHFVALLDAGFPHSLHAIKAMNFSPSLSCHTIFSDGAVVGDRETDLSPRVWGNRCRYGPDGGGG